MKKAKKPEVTTVKHPRDDDQGTDGAWISHAGGRKFVLVLLTMIGVVIIGCVRGDVPTKEIIENLIYLAAIGAGSIAIEDGLGRISKRKG